MFPGTRLAIEDPLWQSQEVAVNLMTDARWEPDTPFSIFGEDYRFADVSCVGSSEPAAGESAQAEMSSVVVGCVARWTHKSLKKGGRWAVPFSGPP